MDAIGDTRMFLGRIGLMVVARAKEIVPRKTGNLGRTIRLGTVDADSAQVIAGGKDGVGYARAVEFGTGLYGPKHKEFYVYPRYKKALAWGGERRLSGSLKTGAKATAFSKGHKIKGMRPRPYLMPAAKEVAAREGVGEIVRAWNDAA